MIKRKPNGRPANPYTLRVQAQPFFGPVRRCGDKLCVVDGTGAYEVTREGEIVGREGPLRKGTANAAKLVPQYIEGKPCFTPKPLTVDNPGADDTPPKAAEPFFPYDLYLDPKFFEMPTCQALARMGIKANLLPVAQTFAQETNQEAKSASLPPLWVRKDGDLMAQWQTALASHQGEQKQAAPEDKKEISPFEQRLHDLRCALGTMAKTGEDTKVFITTDEATGKKLKHGQWLVLVVPVPDMPKDLARLLVKKREDILEWAARGIRSKNLKNKSASEQRPRVFRPRGNKQPKGWWVSAPAPAAAGP